MKIQNILLIIITLISFSNKHMYAQENNRKIMAGGKMSLTNSSSYWANTVSDGKTSDDISFDFTPSAGVLFNNKVGVGLSFKYSYSKTLVIADAGETDYKTNSFLLGPFVKYYMGDAQIKPLIVGSILWGSINLRKEDSEEDLSTKASLRDLYLGGGAAFFLNDFVCLELLINYSNNTLKPKENNDFNYREYTRGLGFDVGFQIFL